MRFDRSGGQVSQLTVTEINPAIGAVVEGLDPTVPLDDETVRQLRAAFDDRGVLVFRGLDIDEQFQQQLLYSLIDDEIPADERVSVQVSNKEEGGLAPYGRLLFHCDNMWARTPQPAISLYGERVEPPSAPTRFAGMRHAWDTLPDELRARVEGLEARHGFDGVYPNRGGDDDVLDASFAASAHSVRPVAMRHPRTGHTLLYVSQQATNEILGLSDEENEELLAALYEHLYDPELIIDHDWREGDLVVWDNVAVQHGRGTVALEGPERTLRKVTGPMNIEPDEYLPPAFSKVAERTA
jgi:alpha-ketoglutarate-dependent taurine dioxygenase